MIGNSLQRARSMGFHTRSATLQWGPREVTSLERTPRGQGAICAIAGRHSKNGGPRALETADWGWRQTPCGPSCHPLFPAQPWIPVSSFINLVVSGFIGS